MADLEPEAQWIRPDALREQQRRERDDVDRGTFDGTGDFGSYYALRRGINSSWLESHGIADDRVAGEYAGQVAALLRSLGGRSARILDVGCGIGTITNELRKHIGASEAVGIDIAEDAIAHASDAYPKCSFSALAAEELSALGGEPFDLIHGREVYPVTRTDSAPYQLAFLGALARHLRPGGTLLLTMVKEARGLGNTYAVLATELESVGLEPIVRVPAIPRRLYRISGRASYLPIVHPMLTRASRLLFPDKLQYFYITRKLAG